MKASEYDIMFRVEDSHWWYRGIRAMFELMTSRYARADNLEVLDVGCGTGANLCCLPASMRGNGIDFSKDALGYCRQRGIGKLAAASADRLPFCDACFDLVYSFDVLCVSSLPEPAIPMREMVRVLKPGGHVILNLPAHEWLRSSHDTHVAVGHRFTRSEVVALVRSAGLEIRFITYWNTILFPLIVPVRLWRRLHPLPASDLDANAGPFVTQLFNAALALERTLLRFTPLPIGLSVMCVAAKPGH